MRFDIFGKYAWIVHLKYKKGLTIGNAFQSILRKSNRKPNKIWIDKGSEFYNNSFKKCLQYNNREMYSTYNQGKPVVDERFIRTLKNKIYKYITPVSENVYIFFSYKHNVYKHIQAQVQSKNKHMISILLSLKLTAC